MRRQNRPPLQNGGAPDGPAIFVIDGENMACSLAKLGCHTNAAGLTQAIGLICEPFDVLPESRVFCPSQWSYPRHLTAKTDGRIAKVQTHRVLANCKNAVDVAMNNYLASLCPRREVTLIVGSGDGFFADTLREGHLLGRWRKILIATTMDDIHHRYVRLCFTVADLKDYASRLDRR